MKKQQRSNSLVLRAIIIFLLLHSISFNVHASSIDKGELLVKPGKCVSLHQGQVCHVQVNVSWSLPQRGNYCLYHSLNTKTLQCWENQSAGKFKHKMKTSDNISYYLKMRQDNTLLLSADLKLAWVYKKKQKSYTSWRLF